MYLLVFIRILLADPAEKILLMRPLTFGGITRWPQSQRDGIRKLKTLLRKAAVRTYDQLLQAVGHVCELITQEEYYNSFKAAGYETD